METQEYRRLGMSGGRNWLLGSLGRTIFRRVLFHLLDDGRMTAIALQAKTSVLPTGASDLAEKGWLPLPRVG